MAREYARRLPQLRHHGAHRCRQDDDDRTHPFLHRQEPQDRRSARWRCHHGLDGAGAGARHHDHVGCDHDVLGRAATARSAASTSSTPPDTSTSPSKSSVRCAFSTAPSRCSMPTPVSSRRPRLSGVRRQVQRPAHDLRQQDGQDRRRLLPLRFDDRSRVLAQLRSSCSCRSVPKTTSPASST
jgi:hypothetical protein